MVDLVKCHPSGDRSKVNAFLAVAGAGLDGPTVLTLTLTSFAASFITIAMGIGGGGLLLAVMASLMPLSALIPVHGVIQLGSNVFRASLLLRHVHWPPLAGFTLGSLIGVVSGGLVVVELPGSVVQIGVGLFVIWSVVRTPPKWLSTLPWVTGVISSFLTMFFGATGLFVANFTKSLILPRQSHVATHAVLMTVQHGLKVAAFAVLGFGFAPWFGFILLLTLAGFAGTLTGRVVLIRLSDRVFKRALDVILILISLRLIWTGVTGD
jgi:uncharacterized membrane protein YfcA